MLVNRAEEDYLKAIYKLTIEANRPLVKNIDLALHLGNSVQTIVEMINKLVGKKLVNYQPYKGVCLTTKGKKEAIRMVRSHRLWEVFLVTKLGYTWENVHKEAENMEHTSSENLIDALDTFLNHPKTCVHGNIIPRDTIKEDRKAVTPLVHLNKGENFEVLRVVDSLSLLTLLDEYEIGLGSILSVLNKDETLKIMALKVGNRTLIISLTMAEMISGKVIN